MQKQNRKQAPKNAGRYKKSILKRTVVSILLVLAALYARDKSPEAFDAIRQKATEATDFVKLIEIITP